MCHIMKPAANKVDEEAMARVVTFKIGETFQVNYRMADYCKDKVKNVPEHLFKMCFGNIERSDFNREMLTRYRLKPEDECGVYFFAIAPSQA